MSDMCIPCLVFAGGQPGHTCDLPAGKPAVCVPTSQRPRVLIWVGSVGLRCARCASARVKNTVTACREVCRSDVESPAGGMLTVWVAPPGRLRRRRRLRRRHRRDRGLACEFSHRLPSACAVTSGRLLTVGRPPATSPASTSPPTSASPPPSARSSGPGGPPPSTPLPPPRAVRPPSLRLRLPRPLCPPHLRLPPLCLCLLPWPCPHRR